MNKLFQDLIWPAVAGNVAWAFFTVATSEKWCGPGVIPRLIALSLMAIYLCYEWLTTDIEKDNLKETYWVGDILHTTFIILFAIMIQNPENWENLSPFSCTNLILPLFFVVTIGGHLSKVWEPKNKSNPCYRWKLAGNSFIGIIVYWSVYIICNKNYLIFLPSSLFTFLLGWRYFKKKFYPRK